MASIGKYTRLVRIKPRFKLVRAPLCSSNKPFVQQLPYQRGPLPAPGWRIPAPYYRIPGGSAASIHIGTASYQGTIPNRLRDVSIPEVTVTEHVLGGVDKFPNDIALVDGITGETTTFKQLEDAVYRVSSGLARQGIRKGDVILLFAANSVEYVIFFHGALALGATLSLANPANLADELVRQANDCDASYICTDEAGNEKVKIACEELNQMKKVFNLGKGSSGEVSLAELLADDGSARPSKVDIDIHKDIAVLLYSSGTTGAPKGVMLSHYNTVANLQQIAAEELWIKQQGTIFAGILPFYHVFGYMISLCRSFQFGQKQIILPKFEPESFLQALDKYKVELLYIVPPMLVFLTKSPQVRKEDLASVSQVACGAAPTRVEIAREFLQKFPHIIFGQVYGMSEYGGSSLTPISDRNVHVDSVGMLLPKTEAKFINMETEETCGPNEEGLLLIRGPQVMLGYKNRPDATAETFRPDGWLNSVRKIPDYYRGINDCFAGDIGYYTEEGLLYIIDRQKELIKYKGHQVAPAELEGLLLSHPAVAEAAVSSIEDEAAGELPRGFVVLKPGQKVSPEEIEDFVAERVAYYKKLRGGVVITDSIPKLPSGKILRRFLKNQPTTKL